MRTLCLSITTCLALASSALAGFSQSTTPSPGGFAQARTFLLTDGSPIIPGFDLSAMSGTASDFHEQAFTGAGSAAASAAGSGSGISNSGSIQAGMGYARLATSNTSLDEAHFPMGVVNGGWKETFTVNHPALTGQPGFMVFQIRARGSMHTTALTGSTWLQITGYKDDLELLRNPLFDRGASDPDDSDRQRSWWRLASFGLSDNRVVDDVVTMAVPITFGQPFTLGVYAAAFSGQRSSGGFGGTSSSAALDFAGNGVTWQGITSVQSAGGPVSGYTIVSGTGLDWTGPYAQCLADLNGDGLTDFGDYLEFLNLFDAMDPAVDFNGDGLVDFADYLEFLNLYEAGC